MRKTLLIFSLLFFNQCFAGNNHGGHNPGNHHKGGWTISAHQHPNFNAQASFWDIFKPLNVLIVPAAIALPFLYESHRDIVSGSNQTSYISLEEQELVDFLNQCIELTHNINMCVQSWEDR